MFFHTVLPGPLAHVASIPLPDLLPTSSAMLLLPCEVEPTARKLQSQQLATAPLLPSATSAEKDHFTSVSQISAATNKKRTTEDTSPAQKVVVVEEGNSENEAAFLQQTVVAAKSLGSRRLANYDSSRRPDVSLLVQRASGTETKRYLSHSLIVGTRVAFKLKVKVSCQRSSMRRTMKLKTRKGLQILKMTIA